MYHWNTAKENTYYTSYTFLITPIRSITTYNCERER